MISLFRMPVFADVADNVTVAVFDGVNPMAFLSSNGKASGFFPELLQYIFSKNNVEIQFVSGNTFQESYLKTMSGEIDIFPGIKYTLDRTDYFDFNKESFIISWSQVFVVPDSEIESVFDLKNKKVALLNSDQNGKNFIKLMKDFDIQFIPVFYNSFEEINMELDKGQVDALVAYNFYIKNNSRLKATEIIFSPARSLVAVKKGTHSELLDIIDRELAILKQDNNSIYYKLLDKWLLAEPYSVVPSWVYITFSVFSAFVFITVLFIFFLRIRVKNIRQKLVASEEVYKALFNDVNDSIFMMKISRGENGAYYDVNRTACDRFGYTKEELLKLSPVDMTADEDQNKIQWVKNKLLTEGHLLFTSVYLTYDGEKVPVEVNAITIKLNNEGFVLAVVRDLSYREEFDNLISAMEAKYRTIADYNYDWEFWQTSERKFIYSSPSCLRISGYSADEFLNDSTLLGKLIYTEDGQIWDDYCTGCSDINKTESSFEYRITRKDGAVVWVEQQCRKIFDSDNRFIGFRGSIRDIDKRKSMEQQLNRRQKLESIGVLAGGIAHDFNNILAIIRGYAELGQIAPDLDPEIRGKFSTILQAANRGVDLTGQILDFARDRRSEIKPVNITAIAEEVYKLIKPSFPGSIKINLNYEDVFIVLADEGQLHQIFINICKNAKLAMPDGGSLDISLSKLDKYIAEKIFPDITYSEVVEISLRDTGCGMSEEVRERIFDPFFTTREVGKGSGMGMSVVHGLIKQWGGRIRVESHRGEGTNVLLYFEIYKGYLENDDIEVFDEKVDKVSSIILFDDESMILDLMEKFLTREGHSVYSFSDALEGLEYFKNNHSSLDLVITDMTMPDLSGDELAAEVKKINSSIPVLLSSGYSEGLMEKTLPYGVDQLIKKPFTGKELISVVNRMLN